VKSVQLQTRFASAGELDATLNPYMTPYMHVFRSAL
jgi:hypothetical protein